MSLIVRAGVSVSVFVCVCVCVSFDMVAWARAHYFFCVPKARSQSISVASILTFAKRHKLQFLVASKYSLRGSNPRPMAHKTIALTTELREQFIES